MPRNTSHTKKNKSSKPKGGIVAGYEITLKNGKKRIITKVFHSKAEMKAYEERTC